MHRIYFALLALLAFALPIEHKYDKPMRFFSLRLIPEGLTLPKWFETKIYFYPSDIAAPILILIALFSLRIPLRRLLFERSAYLLWGIVLFAVISIACSPLWNYPLTYLRLWQWLTGFFLFCVVANGENREQTTRVVLGSLIAMGVLQSLFAIAQYFHQGSFGLRILGEQNFNRWMPNASAFWMTDGCRWIVDRWLGIFHESGVIVRVMGTAAHPNVLGGFLALTALASLEFFEPGSPKMFRRKGWGRRKWLWGALIFLQLFALNLTYSRAAIFAFVMGALLWLWFKRCRSAALLLVFSFCTIGFLFQEQIAHRGGIVNYNEFVSGSDAFRIGHQNLALQMIQKHPLAGVGFQQFSTRAHEFLHTDPSQHVNGAHNIYLMMAAEMGLPALLCFLAFIGSLFWSLRNAVFPPALLSMLIALLFIGFCDFYPTLFQMGRLLFFMTGGLLASYGVLRRECVVELR